MTLTFRTIRVQPAHPAVRPGVRVDHRLPLFACLHDLALFVPQEFHDAAVALPATVDRIGDVSWHPGSLFSQHIVKTFQNLSRLGVVTPGELFGLPYVASGTIFGCHQCRHQYTLVRPAIDISRFGHMAIDAAHSKLSVTRTLPLHHECGRILRVTLLTCPQLCIHSQS